MFGHNNNNGFYLGENCSEKMRKSAQLGAVLGLAVVCFSCEFIRWRLVVLALSPQLGP